MELQDAITLIGQAQFTTTSPGTWADLGCGSGLFTYALANLLPAGSIVHAWDKTNKPLTPLSNPRHITIQQAQLDFLKDELPVLQLDGILMANSLHYVADKPAFIHRAGAHLTPQGAFLIVEYDTTKSSPWVPYPITFPALQTLLYQAGFTSARKLGERPSRYRSGNMYAALFTK